MKVLDKSVKHIYVETKVSKAGKEYKQFSVEFINGYVLSNFLSPEQSFILGALAGEEVVSNEVK